jgi:hypothetical protein
MSAATSRRAAATSTKTARRPAASPRSTTDRPRGILRSKACPRSSRWEGALAASGATDDDDPGLPVELVWPVGLLDPLSPLDDVDGEPPLEPDDPEDCELDDEELDSCGGNGDSLLLDPPEDDGDGVDDWLPPELDSDGGNGDC